MIICAEDIKKWKDKCKNTYRLDPTDIPKPKQKLKLNDLRYKQSQLKDIDFYNNDHLLENLEGIPYLIAVTDQDGYIIKTLVEKSFTDSVQVMGISEGVQFRSQDVGVNSISLTLQKQEPSLVQGNEHYHHFLQGTSCFSTPFQISSSELGTISIMTTTEKMNQQLTDLLNSLSEQFKRTTLTNEFYKEHYHNVFRYLLHLSRNQEVAKDLCQLTFLDVFKGIDSFKQESLPKSWIFRIAYNNFVSWYRKDSKYNFINIEESAFSLPQSKFVQPDQYVEENWQINEIRNLMCELKENEEKVIQLREFKNLSYAEIEVITGWSKAKVKTTLHRARKNLRNIIDSHDLDI